MAIFSRSLRVLVVLFLGIIDLSAQCRSSNQPVLSNRMANYDIRVTLDEATHRVSAKQTLRFTNISPEPIKELRFYMYLNAFKNSESTFLKGTTNIFGNNYTDRRSDEWGWIEVDKIQQTNGADLTSGKRYVQPDDGNAADQTVLMVPLAENIAPGETAVFDLEWRAQMPRTIARAGHSRDFYLFCHWFPQLGVYEPNGVGAWGWNCHQFHRSTEFYADFGVYDIHITAPQSFVMGASGCLVKEQINADGTVTRHYNAADVIDFAWSVYPDFTVLEDRWKEVYIRLLVPHEHKSLGPRYLQALKFALQYLDEHVGKYPYPSITVVDPPFHGLRSGMMEYPTLITVATFYGMPDNIRTMESLVVHEFVHQYFMGMVASNEKEEAWLDEGLVTYYEDRIIDACFGAKKSLVDLGGYHFDNRELTRSEYTTMSNLHEGPIARPGWEFKSSYKPLVYSKTATALRSLHNQLGDEQMDALMAGWFEGWKFKHPRGKDFMAHLKYFLAGHLDGERAAHLYGFFQTAIYGTAYMDYELRLLENVVFFPAQGIFGNNPDSFSYNPGNAPGTEAARITVQRNGDWIFPVEILVTFESGETQTLHWSGVEGLMVFVLPGHGKAVSAQIDPQHKLLVDTDLNNNSKTLQPNSTPLWKYALKAVFWVQNIFHSISFLC